MFSPLFRNRVFLAGLLCLLLIVIGGTLYLRQVQRQTDEALETTTPTTETQPIRLLTQRKRPPFQQIQACLTRKRGRGNRAPTNAFLRTTPVFHN